MKHWIGFLLIAMLFLPGCGPSTQSGVNKEYSFNVDNRGEGDINIEVLLEATSDADTTSGDAGAVQEVDPAIALGMQGSTTSAAAKGSEQVLKDIISYAEQWMKKDADNTDNSQNVPPQSGGSTPNTGTVPDTGSGDTDGDGDDGNTSGVFDPGDYDIIAEAACDQEMSFRDDTESTGIIQKKCVFDKPGPEYGDSFVVQWTSGNTLNVADSSRMNWLVTNEDGDKDYRKYHPYEPNHQGGYVPGSPAEVYAGRNDNSTRAAILVKKP